MVELVVAVVVVVLLRLVVHEVDEEDGAQHCSLHLNPEFNLDYR